MKENMPGSVSRHFLAYLPFPSQDLLFSLTFLKKVCLTPTLKDCY